MMNIKYEASMVCVAEEKIAKDRVVISQIYNLLPTIEEALLEVSGEIDKLAIESAKSLLQNSVLAIRKISENLLLLGISSAHDFLPLTREMRILISRIICIWERNRLIEGQSILMSKLMPCYKKWSNAIKEFLSGSQFRYLQN